MFKGAIMLPNTATTYSEGQNLATFIEQYEREYLITFFGYTMGMQLVNEINTPAPDPDLQAIIDGDTYTDAFGEVWQWIGFDNALLQSPIANYIYVKVLQSRDSQTTGIGEAFQIAENTIRTDAGPKMVNAWNQMVEWNTFLHEYLVANETTYPDYIGIVNSNKHLHKSINRFSL